jgi:hypothetical protein
LGVTARLIQLRQHSGIAAPFVFVAISVLLLAL